MSAVCAALFRPLPFNFRRLLLIRPPIKFNQINHQSKYGKIYENSDIESDANLDLIEFE